MSRAAAAPAAARVAAPDGLGAAVLLAFLGTAGMFYVNLMPAIVSGLRDVLGYSNVQAGYVGSANVYGAAAGALLAVFVLRRVPWKRIEAVTLSLLIVLDIGSMFVTALPLLVALRAVHGLCGGVSVGVALGVMARTRIPQRAFGAQFTLQVLLGGLGLMWLPELAQQHGIWVLFVALAALALLTLAMLPFLAAYPPPVVAAGPGAGARRAALPLGLTLLALFVFQATNMGLFAFMIPLGRHYGLATGFIGNTLGLANWVSALGSLFAMWAGSRYGRWRPLLLALLAAAAGTAAFARSDLAAVFVLANIITGIAWSFVVPYLFSMCAGVDPSGRTATLGGFCSKLGLASGPLLAPFVAGAERYGLLVDASVLSLVICAFAAYWPASQLDRERSTS